jgi:hypothetical protein
MENLPEDTVAHIQSARCTAQRKRGIGAHNKYRKYLLYAITKHGEAKRGLMMMIIGWWWCLLFGLAETQTKTDNWSRFGWKSKSATYYNGGTLQMKRKGCWLYYWSKANRAATKEDHDKRSQEEDQDVFKVTPSNFETLP